MLDKCRASVADARPTLSQRWQMVFMSGIRLQLQPVRQIPLSCHPHHSWQPPCLSNHPASETSTSPAQPPSRVVHSATVDWCICFTRKNQHGGDWERSRPQSPKNVHNFLITVRPLSWACGHGTEMLLIVKIIFSTWLFEGMSQIWQSKEMSQDFVRGQPVAEACYSHSAAATSTAIRITLL